MFRSLEKIDGNPPRVRYILSEEFDDDEVCDFVVQLIRAAGFSPEKIDALGRKLISLARMRS